MSKVAVRRRYESVFIFTPVLSKAQVESAIKQYKGYLSKQKASLLHEEHWGLRELAYPIRHKNLGFYHIMEYDASPGMIAGLDVEIRRDERVMRALTTVLDRHAIAYNESAREKKASAASDTSSVPDKGASTSSPSPVPDRQHKPQASHSPPPSKEGKDAAVNKKEDVVQHPTTSAPALPKEANEDTVDTKALNASSESVEKNTGGGNKKVHSKETSIENEETSTPTDRT